MPWPPPPVVKLCQNVFLIMVVCQNVLIPTVWTLRSRDQPHNLHRSSSMISVTYHVSGQIKTSQSQSYLFPLSRFPFIIFFFLPLNTTTWQCPRSLAPLKHFFLQHQVKHDEDQRWRWGCEVDDSLPRMVRKWGGRKEKIMTGDEGRRDFHKSYWLLQNDAGAFGDYRRCQP